jgi:hypothetical protein
LGGFFHGENMKPTPMDDQTIQATIRTAIQSAISFVETEVAPDRIKAQKAFNGEVTLADEEGRSKVKATKCRDMVRMVKPGIIRMFTQTSPVEYIPRGPDDVKSAQQATAYARWKFDQNQGFSRLHDVIQDALVKKAGILKVYWDEAEEVEFDSYSNVTREQVNFILQQPGVELRYYEQNEDGTYNADITRTKKAGKLKIDSIPPEDFFVDEKATSIADFYICGDSTEMRVGDLVKLGFDFKEVFNLSSEESGSLTSDAEEMVRLGYDDSTSGESPNDPSMRPIMVVEAYMRMDVEGTGIPRLYQFICAGSNYTVLDYEPCDQVPYCVFECDPQPHAFFGKCPVDYLIEDQDASTSLLRGVLDNIHMSNTPRLAFDPDLAQTTDVMNNEIGGVIRTNGPPGNAIIPLSIPFTAHQTLPALMYYDEQIDAKTGVSRAVAGLNADSLQNATATGVQAATEAHSAAMELMARHLAEGGMTQAFQKIHRLIRQHAPADELTMINGTFVPVDPSSWSADMDVKVNVGLGTDQREERMAMLHMVMQDQNAILQNYGPQNPYVSMTQARNTRADLMELAGIHDSARYYNPLTPEIEQQILDQMEQRAQGQEQQSDPNAAFLQAEQMKVQQRMQSDQMRYQIEGQKAAMQDDRERDQMEQDAIIKAMDLLGKYGIQPQPQLTAPIRQMQAMPRG